LRRRPRSKLGCGAKERKKERKKEEEEDQNMHTAMKEMSWTSFYNSSRY
jgi:hypothetical protein